MAPLGASPREVGGTVTYGGFSLHLSAEGELDRPLRDLQVMVATVGSLLSLFSITAYVGLNYDELMSASARLRDDNQPLLADALVYVPTWCTGLSGSLSLLAVTSALGLYTTLCAANVSGHARASSLLLAWVHTHYSLILMELAATLLSIVFLWIGCLAIGIVKSKVDPKVFGGMGIALSTVFFAAWGRIAHLHISRTLPSIRALDEDEAPAPADLA